MTVASCHYIQSTTNSPLTVLLPPTKNGAVLHAEPKPDSISSNAYSRSLVGYYLQSKDQCLKLVSAELATERTTQGHQSLLITVILLAFLDIFESGSGAWSFHIEGIKKMLTAGTMTGTLPWDDNLQNLLREAAMLQTLGSSLAKPGALTSASTLSPVKSTAFSAMTPIGCPIEILSAIEIFASQRRLDSVLAIYDTNIHVLEDALYRIRSYDIVAWAVNNTTQVSVVSLEDLVHLGTIWRRSAEIYADSILSCLAACTLSSDSPGVQDLIAEYTFLERDSDELIKCLIWPTFIAGAASTRFEDRTWALKTLDRIWHIGHCANTRNAVSVLQILWEKYDRLNIAPSSTLGSPHVTDFSPTSHSNWDWLSELSHLEGSWLFI
ncbi:hypothetical protein ACHAPO_008568 [Fusarium lateritium]